MEETMTQMLGRDDHKCRRSRFVHRRLVAKHDEDKSQRPERANFEPHPVGAKCQDARAKHQFAHSHDHAGDRQIPAGNEFPSTASSGLL